MIAVILLILGIESIKVVTDFFLWTAVVLTVVSLADYIAKNHKVLTEGSM